MEPRESLSRSSRDPVGLGESEPYLDLGFDLVDILAPGPSRAGEPNVEEGHGNPEVGRSHGDKSYPTGEGVFKELRLCRFVVKPLP